MRPVLKTSLAWQQRMPRRTARSDNKDTEFTRPCLKKKSLAASLCPRAGDVEKVGGSLEFAWDKTQDFRSRELCSFKARSTCPLMTVQRQIYSQWKRATPSREGHLGLVGGPGRSPRMHFARDPPSLAWMGTHCQKSLPWELHEGLIHRVHPGPWLRPPRLQPRSRHSSPCLSGSREATKVKKKIIFIKMKFT